MIYTRRASIGPERGGAMPPLRAAQKRGYMFPSRARRAPLRTYNPQHIYDIYDKTEAGDCVRRKFSGRASARPSSSLISHATRPR